VASLLAQSRALGIKPALEIGQLAALAKGEPLKLILFIYRYLFKDDGQDSM
jgi:hypothetical protein